MKVFALVLCLALAVSASYLGQKKVQVLEDGSLLIQGENGNEIKITKPSTWNAHHYEILIAGPQGFKKSVEVRDHVFRGVDLSGKVVRSQVDILSTIFKQFQGLVDDVHYEKLLNLVEQAVVKGEISPKVLVYLRNINEAFKGEVLVGEHEHQNYERPQHYFAKHGNQEVTPFTWRHTFETVYPTKYQTYEHAYPQYFEHRYPQVLNNKYEHVPTKFEHTYEHTYPQTYEHVYPQTYEKVLKNYEHVPSKFEHTYEHTYPQTYEHVYPQTYEKVLNKFEHVPTKNYEHTYPQTYEFTYPQTLNKFEHVPSKFEHVPTKFEHVPSQYEHFYPTKFEQTFQRYPVLKMDKKMMEHMPMSHHMDMTMTHEHMMPVNHEQMSHEHKIMNQEHNMEKMETMTMPMMKKMN